MDKYELKFDLEKNKFFAYLGSYIDAGVNITSDLEVSIPGHTFGASIVVGIKGIVAYGKLSLDITLYIFNLYFCFNLYFV